MPLVGSLLSLGNKLAYPAGRRPGFDPAHPAAKGISNGHGASFIPAGVGATNFISLLTGQPVTVTAGTKNAPVNGFVGPMVGNNTNGYRLAGQSTANDTNITLAGISFSTSFAGAVEQITTSSAASGALIEITSSGGVQFGLGGVSNTANLTTVSVNNPYFMAISWFQGTSNNVFFAVTNLLTGKIVSGTGSLNASALAPNGTYQVGYTGETAGGVAAAMFAPFTMPLSALQAWAADPWAFWYPRTPIDWVGKIVAATVNPFVRRNIIRASAKGFR